MISKVQSSRLEKSEFLQAINFCESSQLEACLKLSFIAGMHIDLMSKMFIAIYFFQFFMPGSSYGACAASVQSQSVIREENGISSSEVRCDEQESTE